LRSEASERGGLKGDFLRSSAEIHQYWKSGSCQEERRKTRGKGEFVSSKNERKRRGAYRVLAKGEEVFFCLPE